LIFCISSSSRVIEKDSTAQVLFISSLFHSHYVQEDIRNLCGTTWFLL
jgi:hypothetical protein